MSMANTFYPTDTLKRIQDATTVREGVDACEDLQTWLNAGQPQPVWTAAFRGTSAFVRWRKRQGIQNPPIPEAVRVASIKQGA